METIQDVQNHEEMQYIRLINTILRDGERRDDRTGTGTLSIFAPASLKFQLSRVSSSEEIELILPLLTTKRVFIRGIIAELLWFIEGNTDSKCLSNQGVKIWDGNGSREFLDKLGFSDRASGDLGPVYGFQWRHFGAKYVDCSTDYHGQGVDQLTDIVHKLRNDPFNRRIMLTAWNPKDIPQMVLPPCHILAQFYVSFGSQSSRSSKGSLHCQLYQRSCDVGLGVPFNIASYSLLTHMLARVCDLIPGTFTHVMGDAHIYLDHRDALLQQTTRCPRPFPLLSIRREPGCSLFDWSIDDFTILDYHPHSPIFMKMSV